MTQEEYINKIKRFDTVEEYEYDRETNYINHWVSLTKETNEVNYEIEKKYREPLTFVIQSNGVIRWKKTSTSAPIRTLEYSKDNGQTWANIASSTAGNSISVVSGDTVQFRGNYSTYASQVSNYNCFSGNTCSFSLKGNIMSLINGNNFPALTSLSGTYTFCNLFKGCTGLTDASKLLLPATILANSCYYGMFRGCSKLTTAPALPATTLANYCYQEMFQGCTSLTTAPALPASALTEGCYENMFVGCTNLTTAPALPASALANYCYSGMFQGCSNLNYIKCLATDISATSCTTSWVYNVASTGTFVTPSSTSWSTGTSGIPSGWTRVDAS